MWPGMAHFFKKTKKAGNGPIKGFRGENKLGTILWQLCCPAVRLNNSFCKQTRYADDAVKSESVVVTYPPCESFHY